MKCAHRTFAFAVPWFREVRKIVRDMVLVSFYALACLLSVAEGCHGEFTAQLRGVDIHVGVICRGSCTGAAHIQNTSCTVRSVWAILHAAVTSYSMHALLWCPCTILFLSLLQHRSVKPQIRVHTCLETTTTDADQNVATVNMSHTIAAHVSQSNCSTGGKFHALHLL